VTILSGRDDAPQRPHEDVDRPPGERPPPTEVRVHNPGSGVFIGDHLHLEAEIDGATRYVVLAVESSEVAWLVAAPEEMRGPANLAPIAAGLHARVRATAPTGIVVDVVDTSRPAAPAILAGTQLAGDLDPAVAPVSSSAYERLFFCAWLEGEAARQLVAVDLTDPAQPGAPELLGTTMCDQYPDGGSAAEGVVWMVWGKDANLDIYAVDPGGATHIADYWYVPDGVHDYGPVLGASSDGARAVLDPENDSEFFLFEVPEPTPSGAVAHAYLGIGGPKRLLGVRDAVAYLATSDGIRAYDVADIGAPALLDYDAKIAFGDGLARLVAASGSWLAVVDTEGTIYLAPRDASGAVAPLRVLEGR
jgi:hypothetical protein